MGGVIVKICLTLRRNFNTFHHHKSQKPMKKFIKMLGIAFVACLTFALTSCENEKEINAKSITGKWQYTCEEGDNYYEGKKVTITLEFKSNGYFSERFDVEGEAPEFYESRWKMFDTPDTDPNTIWVDDEGDWMEYYYVVSVSNKELVLAEDEDEPEEYWLHFKKI